jgi:hypothetical protein
MKYYKEFYAIINVQGLTKREVVMDASNQRTDRLTALTDGEYKELMLRLKKLNRIPPGDAMRKALIAMARQLRWYLPISKPGDPLRVDVKRIDNWCIKYGPYKKALMSHNVPELTKVVTVFQKVLSDYLTALKND